MEPLRETYRDDVQGSDSVAGVQQQDTEGLPIQVRSHELLGRAGGLQRSGQREAKGGNVP